MSETPLPWECFRMHLSHSSVFPLLDFCFKSLGDGNLSGAVRRNLCVSRISRDSLMYTFLLPCEEGTLPNMTSSRDRVFCLCHAHSLGFGKLILPSSWTSFDIPVLQMRLRVCRQLAKGHVALRNEIRIRSLNSKSIL